MQVMYTIDYTVRVGGSLPSRFRVYLAEEDTEQGRERAVSFGKASVLRRYTFPDDPDRNPPLTVRSTVVKVTHATC